MLMSQTARSASVTGLPRPGRSDARAAEVLPRRRAAKRNLAVYMLDLPVAADCPAGDDIHMAHREGRYRCVDLGRPALGEHLLACRLDVAGLVPGAALQHHRLAVPAPGQAEARQRLR